MSSLLLFWRHLFGEDVEPLKCKLVAALQDKYDGEEFSAVTQTQIFGSIGRILGLLTLVAASVLIWGESGTVTIRHTSPGRASARYTPSGWCSRTGRSSRRP